MPKKEMEFFDVDVIPWKPVKGFPSGVYEKILSHDPETGSYTRLLKFEAGVETKETLIHDFWEEVYILKGSLIDTAKKLTFPEGSYACRPPGMKHGPYQVPFGCITFEIRYYISKFCIKT